MISFGLLIVLILLIIFVRRFQKRDFYAKLSKFRSASLLETLRILSTTKGSSSEMFILGHEWLNKYGYFSFWSGMDTYVVTGKREDVPLLFKMKDKGNTYHFLRPAMGDGILTTSGQKWKTNRTILEPAYGTKELSTKFLEIFNKHGRLIVDKIQEKGLGVGHSFWPLIIETSGRMNSETIIGSGDLYFSMGYGSKAKSVEQIMMKRLYSPWLYPDFMFNLYLFLTNQLGVIEAVRDLFAETLQKRKKQMTENNFEASKTSTEPRKVVLNYLMENNLTDENLIDELMSLMTAGTDTVATGISYTLLMLAMHPDIQNQVYEELLSVFSDDGDRDIGMSDLHKLTFLEQCVKESLRKLSIIPFLERHVTSEVTLSDGRVVPVGVNLVWSIYNIHNDPKYYPNPEVWNPHNFDEDAVAKRPANTFIPFSIGARQCIGNKSAMMSMKTCLAKILNNFEVTTSQTEAKLVYYLAARCTSGYSLRFEKR